MAVCNFLATYACPCPSPNFKIIFAITNPKRSSVRTASTTSTTDQKWNISKEYNLEEDFRDEYAKKMEELKQLVLQHYSNLDDQEMMSRKQSLVLVDVIQRLGLEHHFDEEIEMILGRIYHSTTNSTALQSDLYHLSLYFRLLRNQGYHVAADMLDVIKGNDGRFKEKLRHDIRGLMELHEAAQLRFSNEGIIDEAEEFSRVNLNEFLANIKDDDDWHNTTKLIKNSLTRPQHMNIPRLTARNYTDALKGSKKEWENTLSELAKMDFLMGDLLHQQELLQISKWWENVGIAEKLQRARNQPVKWYTWSMALLINNPSLRLERIELTKAIAFIYILDDIFDLYGMMDELTLFMQAINRWEYSAIDTLPEYMRKSYKALLDTTNSIAQKVEERFGTNPIDSLKDTWVSLCRAFLTEARWFRSEKLPTANEYLENGKVSSGVHVVIVHLFFLLGLGNGRPSIDLNHTSTLVSSIATILRLSDDLGSAMDERQDGFDGSYIKCRMNDAPKLSEKEARQHVEDIISNQWKYLNEECFLCLNHSSLSDFRRASLNFARMVPLMYTYDENQRLPLLEEHVNTAKLFNYKLMSHDPLD